jgi:hypothetical protein
VVYLCPLLSYFIVDLSGPVVKYHHTWMTLQGAAENSQGLMLALGMKCLNVS